MVFPRPPRNHYYNTTTISAPARSEPSIHELTLSAEKWFHGCTGSDRGFRNYRNRYGAGKLGEMAVRCFVRGRRNLEDGALEGVHWEPVGTGLWREVRRSDLVSVALWKEFASAYGQEYPWPGSLNERLSYQTPTIPPGLLSELLPALGSPRGLLLTSLTLRNVELTRAQWVGLSKLDNLAILQVNDSLGYSDQVVRAWGERAVQNGAFSQLRVLEVVDEDEVTVESLRNLSLFAVLQVCQLSGRGFTPRALLDIKRHGWTRLCEHSGDNIRSLNNDLEWLNWSRLCPQSASCKKAQHLFASLQRTIGLPLLKARCSPKSVDWTRQPAGRTVFTMIPDTSRPAKRNLESPKENYRPAPAKRKPVLRQGARKDANDLIEQLSGGPRERG